MLVFSWPFSNKVPEVLISLEKKSLENQPIQQFETPTFLSFSHGTNKQPCVRITAQRNVVHLEPSIYPPAHPGKLSPSPHLNPLSASNPGSLPQLMT